MSTIVGILTFISMINTTSERLKAINFFICRYFSHYEQLKFRAQLSMKKFYNLGTWSPGYKTFLMLTSTEHKIWDAENEDFSYTLELSCFYPVGKC